MEKENNMRDIEIVQFGETLQGIKTYFVRCGCKTFVFTTRNEVVDFVHDYLGNPQMFEKKYYQEINKKEIGIPNPNQIEEKQVNQEERPSGLMGHAVGKGLRSTLERGD